MVLRAQSLPPQSLEFKKAIEQVVKLVCESNRLRRSLKTQNVRSDHPQYGAFYDEAVFLLMDWLPTAIQKKQYNPGRGEVMAWLNDKLQYLFKDAVRDLTGVRTPFAVGIDLENLDEQGELPADMNPWSALMAQEELDSSEVWRLYKAQDPDGLLQKVVFESIRFEQLIDAKNQGKSMRKLAIELSVNANTLSSIYTRHKDQFFESVRRFKQSLQPPDE
ncbi:hypothetical protein [Limnothrix redekei]|uniref:Sigma-70 family RNA polymerase sigma factor n=1 Tax=Limnothrix redekei LRLZ20PSL1 TaxID=3112953 RepID=A0ABW7CBP9_9CYAN